MCQYSYCRFFDFKRESWSRPDRFPLPYEHPVKNSVVLLALLVNLVWVGTLWVSICKNEISKELDSQLAIFKVPVIVVNSILSVGYLIGIFKVDQVDADEVCGQYNLNLSLIFSSVSSIILSSIPKRDLQGENVLLFLAYLILLILEAVAILVLPLAIAIASFKLLRDKLCPSKVVVGEMIPSVFAHYPLNDEDDQSLPHTEGEKVATEDMTFRVPDLPPVADYGSVASRV